MTAAILSPVTLAEVERRTLAGPRVGAALAACDCLEEMGRHLSAAAGRAIMGAYMVTLVTDTRRRDSSDAAREWAALSSGTR